ncbi:hypothetical protein WR25_00260 [Diploscapter pachys]|uniref:COP9 signalosome complex subunit 5 n=1 Tax=Diploscapter pachys TaxID=2018661 RepID=A0A2A2JQV2_9BILA|nr:hypothetical protein WR25_00260 [Diploscapter pachys]
MAESMEAVAPTGTGTDNSIPQQNWELANQIKVDELFEHSASIQSEIRAAKPWDKDPQYFKLVMGLLQGRVDAHCFIILDTFALPVEGTETRVNAQQQAYEYMTVYTDRSERMGIKEKIVGWYHSHPGYGCWLSGIDCATQQMNQQFQEPWLAIVVDPLRTMSAGKARHFRDIRRFMSIVDIGAFRTYPKGYKPPERGPQEYQMIPINKIEDFGVHCNEYYPLEIQFFKSELDAQLLRALWNSHWLNTLSSSPLLSNVEFIRNQMADVTQKLKVIEKACGSSKPSEQTFEKLQKVALDSESIGHEVLAGHLSQCLKMHLFGAGDKNFKLEHASKANGSNEGQKIIDADMVE